MRTAKRLSMVYKEAKVVPYDEHSRIVLMSDCHRGVGNWGDNFLNNQNLFYVALAYYYKENFTYIELGDGDELWENRDMTRIIQTHSDAFWLLEKFYAENRLYMIYGNHDHVKENHRFVTKYMKQYFCDSSKTYCSLFPGIEVYEGIILRNEITKDSIFLTHGHQGDTMNDRLWKLGRFLVRYLWRNLEMTGVQDPTDVAINIEKKNRIEQKISKWSHEQNQMIVTGHTHRAMFPEVGEGLYFNDGSCVHPRCITAIEIDEGMISLVKWSVFTREDGTMYVGKAVLEGPVLLQNYFDSIKN